MNLKVFASAICIASAGFSCGPAATPNAESDAVATLPIADAPAATQPRKVALPVVAEAPRVIMVELQGAVAQPGAYRFSPDARLFDALQRAGGALENAEIRDLNIAALLIDGSVLTVPFRREPDSAPPPTAAVLNPSVYTRSGWDASADSTEVAQVPMGPAAVAALLDLNTASQEALETLPGVGPKTAEKIIQFRTQQPFTSVDDLQFIRGLGEKRVETLRPLVTVR